SPVQRRRMQRSHGIASMVLHRSVPSLSVSLSVFARRCGIFSGDSIPSKQRNGMEIKRGIPVSGGVAIGPALVVDTEGFRIPQRSVEPDQIEAEVARLHRALKAAAAEARGHEQTLHDRLGRQYAAIFEAHALLIEDPTLIG